VGGNNIGGSLDILSNMVTFSYDVVEHQKWRTVGQTVRALRDQINLADYPYLMCGYLSNHVGFVSYRLGTGPDLPLYI
jgi:hypothetical protein